MSQSTQIVYKTRPIPPHNTPDYSWLAIHNGRVSAAYMRVPEFAPIYDRGLKSWREERDRLKREYEKLLDPNEQTVTDVDVLWEKRNALEQAEDHVRAYGDAVQRVFTPGIETQAFFWGNDESIMHVGTRPGGLSREFHWSEGERLVRIIAPVWLLTLTSFVVAFIALHSFMRAAMRRRRGRCVSCGYDLRASPERCPECGATAGVV